MYLSEQAGFASARTQRRRFTRYQVQCRARIVIGTRHYAGYLHNISQGGAKLRTITPIRKLGAVTIRLPDLEPIRCELRWSDSYNAGVCFESALSRAELRKWARTRLLFGGAGMPECEIAPWQGSNEVQAASPS